MVIAALVGPLASKAAFNRDAFSESAAGYYLSTGKPARVRTFANCKVGCIPTRWSALRISYAIGDINV